MTTTEDKTQDTSLHGPNLILDVENFGPIAEAKNIEFKPMTVFVGPSNTGKTYLAMLLHSFLQAYNNTGFPYIFPIRFAPAVDLTDHQVGEFYRLLRGSYSRGTHDDLRTRDKSTITFEWDCLPTDLQRVLEDSGVKWGEWAAAHTSDFLKENFQVENLDSLNRHSAVSASDARIRIFDSHHIFRVNINDAQSKIMIDGIPLIVFGEHLVNAFATGAINIDDDLEDARRDFARSVNRSIADHMGRFPKSFYLPASRTGIMTTFGALAPTVIRSSGGTGGESETTIRLNRVTRDFLGHLAEAKDHRPGENRSGDNVTRGSERVANKLEATVIGGNITVAAREIGIPEIALEFDDLVTPIERASSMVTELAPIVLLLRGRVNEGDLLIIDEPEAHLHPEAQQQMAAALAFMVRSGLRVLITTHSHYMVEQLGNFVAVSTLEPDERKSVLKLGGALGDEDVYLDESEVAVYDFATDKSENGSVVETVEFNKDYGYFPRDHNRAIADQMNRTQRVIEARIDQDDPVSAQ